MRRKFSRQSLALIIAGQLCMVIAALLMRSSLMGEDMADFIRGFGVALMVGALFTGNKTERCNKAGQC